MSPRYTRSAHLSARHRDILLLAAEGKRDKEIAKSLQIGLSTVKEHWIHIRFRLGTDSRIDSILRAHKRGLIDALAVVRE